MNKYIIKTVCLLLVSISVFAQTKEERKYNEKATLVQGEIWDGSDKAFDVTTVPEKYSNEGAVVLARSVEVSNSTKRKFKMIYIWGGSVKQYRYFTTIRERILIKDKSALEEFSTLNYKKLSDNTVNIAFYKLLNTSTTYIGIKIIKPSGKTVKINPGEEEVLTKNKSKDKEGKIAIPDLQLGDILEYYIHVEEVTEDNVSIMGPHVYMLRDDYPILNYHVKYTLDDKSGADIINLNGAQQMKKSINEDKDMVLEFTETDLPKMGKNIWAAKVRQTPLYAVRYGFSGSGIYAKPGEVEQGPYLEILKGKLPEIFSGPMQYRPFYPKALFEKHFDGRKNVLAIPVDSAVSFLYNFYKLWLYVVNSAGNFTDFKVSNERNNKSLDWFNSATTFCEVLRGYDIKGDIVVTCNRLYGDLNDAFLIGDFETFVRININGTIKWYCFNGFFEDEGRLAAAYEGQHALIYTRDLKGMGTRFKTNGEIITLPVSKSNENILSESLNVSLNKTNAQLVNIERTVNATGHMRQNLQKPLLLAEDCEFAFGKLANWPITLESWSKDKKTAGKAEELKAAFAKERQRRHKDDFIEEIKEQYDQEPKELTSFKINNTGLAIANPVFNFTTNFTMNDFVKKAGNNLILDVGRLMGAYKKTEGKDTLRTMDVYMPAARQLNYEINVTIPDGYNVKGIDALNKKVENDIASFTSTAKLNGNVANITVHRIYNNSFEPVSNWPKLLMVMNAAADFTNLKLLLEKKN